MRFLAKVHVHDSEDMVQNREGLVEEKKGDISGFLFLFFSLIRTFAPHNALPIKTTDKILLQLL